MKRYGDGSVESEDKMVDLRQCGLMEFERIVADFHIYATRNSAIRLRIQHEEEAGNKYAVDKLYEMLEENKMEKLVLVVDMINDFMHPDGVLFIGDKSVAAKLVVDLAKYLDEARKKGNHIIYCVDNHAPDDKEFRLFGKHALRDTWGSEVIEGLTPVKGDTVLPKTRYSAFYGTDLAYRIVHKSLGKVVVTGVCTSICVMDTAQGVSYRGYDLMVPENLCADLSEESHKAALERMKIIYGADISAV